MSGWVLLLILIGAGSAGLYLLGLRAGLLKLGAAALFLGASGYAVQGRPDLEGSPKAAGAESPAIPLTSARRAFYGQFTAHEHWMIIADSYMRRGNTADAVGVLKNAAQTYPGDPSLWVSLGNALVEHAGAMTPAAQLAFHRAGELSPDHPAPPFFLGLALARSGDRQSAVSIWRELLANAPADASWRPLVEDGVAALGPSVSKL